MRNEEIIKHVLSAVQSASKISNLKIKSRQRSYVDARRIAYYILRNVHGFSYQAIATEFDKNHASIMHGIKDFEFLLKSDNVLNEMYKKSISKISQGDLRKEQILKEITELPEEFLTLI